MEFQSQISKPMQNAGIIASVKNIDLSLKITYIYFLSKYLEQFISYNEKCPILCLIQLIFAPAI